MNVGGYSPSYDYYAGQYAHLSRQELKPNTIYEIRVLKVKCSGKINLHIVDKNISAQLDRICKEGALYFSQNDQNAATPMEMAHLGRIFLARFSSGIWHRVCVIGVDGEVVAVMCIDTGEECTLKGTCLHPIPNIYLNLPPQVIEDVAVQNWNSCLSDNVTHELAKYLGGRSLRGRFRPPNLIEFIDANVSEDIRELAGPLKRSFSLAHTTSIQPPQHADMQETAADTNWLHLSALVGTNLRVCRMLEDRVHCTHDDDRCCCTYSHFLVEPWRTPDIYEEMNAHISKFCRFGSALRKRHDGMCQGSLVYAYNWEDARWYRAMVEGGHQSTVSVKFCDSGSKVRATVALGKVRRAEHLCYQRDMVAANRVVLTLTPVAGHRTSVLKYIKKHQDEVGAGDLVGFRFEILCQVGVNMFAGRFLRVDSDFSPGDIVLGSLPPLTDIHSPPSCLVNRKVGDKLQALVCGLYLLSEDVSGGRIVIQILSEHDMETLRIFHTRVQEIWCELLPFTLESSETEKVECCVVKFDGLYLRAMVATKGVCKKDAGCAYDVVLLDIERSLHHTHVPPENIRLFPSSGTAPLVTLCTDMISTWDAGWKPTKENSVAALSGLKYKAGVRRDDVEQQILPILCGDQTTSSPFIGKLFDIVITSVTRGRFEVNLRETFTLTDARGSLLATDLVEEMK